MCVRTMYIIRKHMIEAGVEHFIIYLKLPFFSTVKYFSLGKTFLFIFNTYRYMYSTSLYMFANYFCDTRYIRHALPSTSTLRADATDDIQLLKFIGARPKLNFLFFYHIFK